MNLVSIITPTYNRAYILGEAIKSVLAQTYSNWELIIIDDGSTDNTKEVVEKFADSRIKYRFQEHQNQVVARNSALQHAQGDWIAYLDSDNTLRPAYLETVLSWLERNPNTVWGFPRGTRILELYQNGKLVKSIDQSAELSEKITVQDIFHRKLHTDTTGAFHSRKVIDDGVRFNANMHKMEDWEFFLTLGNRYPENFLYVPVVLYDYHQRFGTDGLVSNSTYREWAKLFEYIYQKHKNDKLMQGQTWYPERVNKWNKLADDFEKGAIPPYQMYYFKDF
ncbi:MAG: glycosyltransferase family 2 protein [Candidatus Doudnabacteria bacterium]|nr:glycosyltransferase family 2 protein [Candidatus Doudnabacteria bacterium]